MNYPFGKNILITGASSGIGLASAKLFASKGYNVWGIARKVPDLHLSGIRFCVMDVTDEKQVESVVANIETEAFSLTGHHLSIVLDCAGNGITGSAEATPTEMVRRQMEVNFFGTLTVNRAALPYLRQEPRSLVMMISSVAGRISVPFQGHYSCSKYALEAYGEALRMESRRFGVHVAMIEPGDTSTGFTKNRIIAEPKESPYRKMVEKTTKKIADDELSGAKAESVAKTALRIAGSRHVPVRRAVGFVSKLELFLIRFLPSSLVDRIVGTLYLKGTSS
ncbi:MAG: SDR family oxidoreductase [Sphaerochaetaceae bacterium]